MSALATPWTVAHQAPLSMGFSGKNAGVGCRALLQGIFSTLGSNPGLLHCKRILHQLSYPGSPIKHRVTIIIPLILVGIKTGKSIETENRLGGCLVLGVGDGDDC